MPTGIPSDTANSAKNIAQAIAKQMAREPLEILKDAREQVTNEEFDPSGGLQKDTGSGDEAKKLQAHQSELADKAKSSRLIAALNRELEDIHKQKIFKELQGRIAAGEVIPLIEYTELTMEQRQVLQAQMEAVKQQKAMQLASNELQGVPSVTSKPSRRFGAGQKQEAEKQQTRVEKPVPPSG